MDASPIAQLLLVDHEVMIAAGIENRWDAWRTRVELIAASVRNADPNDNLVSLHRQQPATNFDTGRPRKIGQLLNDPRHE